MRANIIQSIAFGILKLLLFAVLLVLGVVFVPDEFMERIERAAGVAGDYLSVEAQKRVPAVIQDVSRQAGETKGDAKNLYQSLTEKYWPAISGWISNHQLERN
jgi:hypothetical protein